MKLKFANMQHIQQQQNIFMNLFLSHMKFGLMCLIFIIQNFNLTPEILSFTWSLCPPAKSRGTSTFGHRSSIIEEKTDRSLSPRRGRKVSLMADTMDNSSSASNFSGTNRSSSTVKEEGNKDCENKYENVCMTH